MKNIFFAIGLMAVVSANIGSGMDDFQPNAINRDTPSCLTLTDADIQRMRVSGAHGSENLDSSMHSYLAQQQEININDDQKNINKVVPIHKVCNAIYKQKNSKVEAFLRGDPTIINTYHEHNKNCKIFNAEYQRIYFFYRHDKVIPLHIAVAANNYDCIKLLLHEYKANPNAKTLHLSSEHATSLHLAQNSTIAHLLVVFHAEIDAKDIHGYTPLYLSLFNPYVYPNFPVAEVLAKCGANINQGGACWGTFLHEALHRSGGMIDIIRFLLRHGAEKNMINKDGETPHQVAIQLHNGYEDLINLLR